MDKNRLAKLENLIKLVDEGITKEEFVKAFEAVVKQLLAVEQKLIDKNEEAVQVLKELHNQLLSDTNVSLSSLQGELRQAIDGALQEQSVGLNFIRDKVRRIKGGLDGKNGLDGLPGRDGSPDTAEQVRDKLEALNGEARLRIEAIGGLDERLKEIDARRTLRGGGFSKIAMDGHIVDDETPSGTINGVNKDFTTAGIPNPNTSLKVYLNGARQRLAEDYTLSKNTISFTVAPPTGSILLVDYRI